MSRDDDAGQAGEEPRTLEEAHQALREARAEAREARELLRALAHAVRTPLSGVLMRAEMIEMGQHGPVAEEQREALRKIRGTARQISQVMEQLLRLERARRGEPPLRPARLSLGPRLGPLIAQLEPVATGQGVALKADGLVEAPAAREELSLDPQVLQALLLPLLCEALAHARAELRLELLEEGGAIALRIGGLGLGARALEELLERSFFGAAGEPPSAGVGLALCRRWAELLGGSLLAEEGGLLLRLPRIN